MPVGAQSNESQPKPAKNVLICMSLFIVILVLYTIHMYVCMQSTSGVHIIQMSVRFSGRRLCRRYYGCLFDCNAGI